MSLDSIFTHVNKAPVIEVFALSDLFKKDNHPSKVNLTVGAYRDDAGKPYVLPVVRKAEERILANEALNKEYLPITGLPEFCQKAIELLLGKDNEFILTKRCDGIQALGGTGAIYICLNFLRTVMKFDNVAVSQPTWPNHKGMSLSLGYKVFDYCYWDKENKVVAFDEMVKSLKSLPDKTVVILHASAHNPTGMDLSQEQWKEIVTVIKEKSLFPLIDIAYQGFASGDLDKDSWIIRHLAERNFEFLIAQSFSKNFGLYNERVGNAVIITKDAKATELVKDQMKVIVRKTWSNPPDHGARIVQTILTDSQLFEEWKNSIRTMSGRIIEMREKLYKALTEINTLGDWKHIIQQSGMFSYTGLTEKHAQQLKDEFHIYMLSDGRINMCGLNHSNITYVANAINSVLQNSQ